MSYRKIHDKFWTDPDMEELTPEQKYFYLYLMTNPRVNQIGLYEFSIKHACLETGYNEDTVKKLLDSFEEIEKIKRSDETRELLVIKFWYHNQSKSPKVMSHVRELLNTVKDRQLIQYICGIDTLSQEEEYKEEKKEKEELPFSSDSFIKTWGDWKLFRKEIKKPLTERSFNMQLKFLKAYSEPDAIKILEQSILNGWQGLFPLREDKKINGQKFPDYWSSKFAATLQGQSYMDYEKHLKSIGWEKVTAPGGTNWNKPKL
jgi:hypothetical protein